MSKNKIASSEDGMSAGDAATTTVFGIGLPSWDVYTDLLLIITLLTPYYCLPYSADEYIKRFSTIEISNPTDRRNFRIRVPPAPETFYDIGKDAQKIYCLIFYFL